MKKIFFLIAVLFSFTGYAQTVGQLRYDTVKMYKVGGTTELILQNASSGVVGGVLRNVINGRTVFQTVVDTVFKNATADSFVYYIGGVRRAFKDSSGSGTYARDTIVAGRGLTGTAINANKVQLDNDSAVHIVTQINDTTVSYTHYDGRIDTVTIVSSGGGGGSNIYNSDGIIDVSTDRVVTIPETSTLEFKRTDGDGTIVSYKQSGSGVLIGINGTDSRLISANIQDGTINFDCYSDGVEGVGLAIDYTGTVYTDALSTPTGIRYGNDYSATFINRSLVDKEYVDNAVAGGTSQWTDTTAGIYYADKVGIGGVINPANALTVSGSATVGTGHSNAGTNNFISGSGSTVGTGGNNIIAGSDHNVANNSGANVIFGESHTFGNAEASSIIYGALNTVGDGANDALVGGTASAVYGLGAICFGIGNEASGETAVTMGGSGNYSNGIYSGTFAGVNSEAEDTAAVAIGGQNNSVSGVNAAILGGENNFTSGRNTVVLGGSGINGTMANTTYVDSLRVGGKIVAPNLPSSGTYSKSLAIDASGNIYKKDTAALTVSNLGGLGAGVATLLAAAPTGTTSLVGSASPTITGVLTAAVISATGVVATSSTLRSGISSPIEHAASNRFTASSNGFENLTSSAGTANTANLSVGSLRTGYVAKTANYTATAFDETISCSTNAFTITLPTAVGCAGQKYNITNSTAANTITIGTTSSQVFANVTSTPTTISLVGLGAVIVVSDGAAWLQLK